MSWRSIRSNIGEHESSIYKVSKSSRTCRFYIDILKEYQANFCGTEDTKSVNYSKGCVGINSYALNRRVSRQNLDEFWINVQEITAVCRDYLKLWLLPTFNAYIEFQVPRRTALYYYHKNMKVWTLDESSLDPNVLFVFCYGLVVTEYNVSFSSHIWEYFRKYNLQLEKKVTATAITYCVFLLFKLHRKNYQPKAKNNWARLLKKSLIVGLRFLIKSEWKVR